MRAKRFGRRSNHHRVTGGSWDDFSFPELIKEAPKHLFGVDAIGEASPASLNRAGDVVVFGVKNRISECPRGYGFEWEGLETMLFDDLLPERSFIGLYSVSRSGRGSAIHRRACAGTGR